MITLHTSFSCLLYWCKGPLLASTCFLLHLLYLLEGSSLNYRSVAIIPRFLFLLGVAGRRIISFGLCSTSTMVDWKNYYTLVDHPNGVMFFCILSMSCLFFCILSMSCSRIASSQAQTSIELAQSSSSQLNFFLVFSYSTQLVYTPRPFMRNLGQILPNQGFWSILNFSH